MVDSFNNINKFFEDNTIDRGKNLPYRFSTLYLLIRDIKVCLKLDPNQETDINFKTYGAEWPGMMTIFSGIDLMGKLLKGNNRDNECKTRFIDFLILYFKIEEDDAKIIWALRNALDHSFNLYDRRTNFSLVNKRGVALISDKTANQIEYKQINVYKLYRKFRKACDLYHKDLLHPEKADLRSKFNRMYKKYGITHMY
jgi:hypothetical protein